MSDPVKNAKSRILKAAIPLFQKEGYRNVSVSQICKVSGVSRASFYAVFENKKDIIVHILEETRTDHNAAFDSFVRAKNDFERLWTIVDRFVSIGLTFGPELTGALLSLDLETPLGVYDSISGMNEWVIPLVRNCQESGLIRNQTEADVLVPIVTNAGFAVSYEWCRQKGAFDLRKETRRRVEILYDAAPETRWRT